jgi:DNA invertase Pin-like site-specific DNA recombinase
MAILCEVGLMVFEDETCKESARAELLVLQYKTVIQSIPRHKFISSKLREGMINRQKNGQKKGGPKPKTLWGKWGLAETTLKKIFAAMPDKYHKMKSGTPIYNAHQKLVLDHYRTKFVSS